MQSLVSFKFSTTRKYLTFKIEPTLANDLLSKLFGCQHQEKVLLSHASPQKSFHSRLAIDSRLRIDSLRELWECLIYPLYNLIDHVAGFNNFVEPSNIVYDIPTPGIDGAIEKLKTLVRVVINPKEENIKIRAREMRVKRVRTLDEAVETAVSTWYFPLSLSDTGFRTGICWKLEIRPVPIGDTQSVPFGVYERSFVATSLSLNHKSFTSWRKYTMTIPA